MEVLKPYLKYKISGVSWLGNIPEHWEVKRIKYLFHEQDKRTETGLESLLSVSHYTGVTQKSDKVASVAMITNAKTLIGYKIVEKNDLVINIMLAWNGSLGISKFNGITSPAYCVYKSLIGGERYFGYLFRTKNAQQEFKKQSTGIIESRLRLYSDKFFNTKAAVPTNKEQIAIANFLDYKTEKIERFIRKKKQLIKLLNEQKAGIINNAVTKGLNLSIKTKSSGIEWVGDIPEHWEVVKLRYLSRITTGNKNTEDKVENGFYDFFVRSQKIAKINSYSFDGEGILTAGDGAGVGKVFHYINGKCDYHQRVYLFYKFSNTVYGKYLFYFLQKFLKNELMIYNAKSTVDSVRLPVLKDFLVTLPSVQEQTEIVFYIEKETTILNKAIVTIEKEIALVQEYRMAIITEAVTGKIDIRNYNLPTIEEDEPFEELEEEMDMISEDEAEYQNQDAE